MKAISIICITALLLLMYFAIYAARDLLDEECEKVPKWLIGSICAVAVTALYILAINEILCE